MRAAKVFWGAVVFTTIFAGAVSAMAGSDHCGSPDIMRWPLPKGSYIQLKTPVAQQIRIVSCGRYEIYSTRPVPDGKNILLSELSYGDADVYTTDRGQVCMKCN